MGRYLYQYLVQILGPRICYLQTVFAPTWILTRAKNWGRHLAQIVSHGGGNVVPKSEVALVEIWGFWRIRGW